MRLLIIRHAQSTNNVLLDHGREEDRVEDPEITELGTMQAHCLGRMLASLPEPGSNCPWQLAWRPAALCTSLMLRAAHTSSILAEHTEAQLEGWEDLHEVGGIYLEDPATGERRGLPGAAREVFARRFPALELPDSVGPRGWWNRPFETEPDPVIARAERVRKRLLGLLTLPGSATRTLGMMTHAGFAGYLLPVLLGIAGAGRLSIELHNTGCTLLEMAPEQSRLIFHNSLRHLPLESVT
jgi:broad specificity phosphatase PhoE